MESWELMLNAQQLPSHCYLSPICVPQGHSSCSDLLAYHVVCASGTKLSPFLTTVIQIKQLKQFYEVYAPHAAAHYIKAINREREKEMERMVVSTFWAQPPPPPTRTRIISITHNMSQTLSSRTLRMLRRIEPLTSITPILEINCNTSSATGINCIKGSSGLRMNREREQPQKSQEEAKKTLSLVYVVMTFRVFLLSLNISNLTDRSIFSPCSDIAVELTADNGTSASFASISF